MTAEAEADEDAPGAEVDVPDVVELVTLERVPVLDGIELEDGGELVAMLLLLPELVLAGTIPVPIMVEIGVPKRVVVPSSTMLPPV